jgi:hypothetical protein
MLSHAESLIPNFVNVEDIQLLRLRVPHKYCFSTWHFHFSMTDFEISFARISIFKDNDEMK